jgi:hypothetical protein
MTITPPERSVVFVFYNQFAMTTNTTQISVMKPEDLVGAPDGRFSVAFESN